MIANLAVPIFVCYNVSWFLQTTYMLGNKICSYATPPSLSLPHSLWCIVHVVHIRVSLVKGRMTNYGVGTPAMQPSQL